MCCQVRGVIRNFIWGGKDTPARAKVKWDTLVLPTAQGGLGVTDPKSQSEALLAKLMVRGLAPGDEPWKELIRHNADQTKLPVHGKGPTNPDLNWLLAAPKFKRLQASMWKSIVGAWLNVKLGLTKSDPSTGEDILRQPIFGNPSILNASGDPLGVSGRGEGSALAHAGCIRIKHLWNPENRNWKGLSELGMNRHASTMRGRDIITASIPWSPDELDFHIKVGDWIADPTPDTGNPLDWVYQVLALTRGKAEVLEFQRSARDGRIQATSKHIHTIHTAKYRTVRVLHQEKPGTTLRVSKDLPAPSTKTLVLWVFETGFIRDLALALQPATRRCSFLWLHRQKRLHQYPTSDPPLQHGDLHSRSQSPQHIQRPANRQALAQRTTTQSGYTHLAHFKPRPPSGHLASTHGHRPAM
jgi:hypothetical protein